MPNTHQSTKHPMRHPFSPRPSPHTPHIIFLIIIITTTIILYIATSTGGIK